MVRLDELTQLQASVESEVLGREPIAVQQTGERRRPFQPFLPRAAAQDELDEVLRRPDVPAALRARAESGEVQPTRSGAVADEAAAVEAREAMALLGRIDPRHFVGSGLHRMGEDEYALRILVQDAYGERTLQIAEEALRKAGSGASIVRIGQVELSRVAPGARCRTPGGSWGSLGAVVHRGGEVMLLSASHVIARAGRGIAGDAVGVRFEDGTELSAVLEATAPLTRGREELNLVDGALARPVQPDALEAAIGALGPAVMPVPPFVEDALFDDEVEKVGGASDRTEGIVSELNVTVSAVLRLPFPTLFEFSGQLRIVGSDDQRFSRPGDSGSLVLRRGSRDPVGLIFAGTAVDSYANPMSLTIDALQFAFGEAQRNGLA